MNRLRQWWNNGLSKWVKFVFLMLLANGLPAFIILMTLPTRTETFFVWTITPLSTDIDPGFSRPWLAD